MQAKQILLSKINWLDDIDALAMHRQPSPSRENLQDLKYQQLDLSQNKKTELPLVAITLVTIGSPAFLRSFRTRDFPPLPHGRFGFEKHGLLNTKITISKVSKILKN